MAATTCWDEMKPYLKGCSIATPQLPGHGDSRDAAQAGITFADLRQLAAALAAAAPDDSIWVGWSLGGLVAQMIAVWHPEKVRHLICVCSSPRFIAADDWRDGMPPARFDRFACKLETDHRACEREFIALQTMGDSNEGALRKRLRGCLARPCDAGELKAGLDVLAQTDMREAIAGCQCPVSFVAGEHDRLTSAKSLKAASRLPPDGRYHCIPATAHAPMLSSPAEFARALERCLHV